MTARRRLALVVVLYWSQSLSAIASKVPTSPIMAADAPISVICAEPDCW